MAERADGPRVVSRKILAGMLLGCLVFGFALGVYAGIARGIPFVGETRSDWAIGIYTGDTPYSLSAPRNIRNPVITAADVSDIPAQLVADPFLVREQDTWYMFFEVMNEQTDQGDIALATSADGLRWRYDRVVLDEPFHLSYPFVFEWEGAYYMIPETSGANAVRLYRATEFPTQWTLVGTLMEGSPYLDSVVVRFEDRWWLFTTPTHDNDMLRLYYADELLGPWVEHPQSPIVAGDANIARPAGRFILQDGRIIRYAQDDEPGYGNQVLAFEITELTTTTYEERLVSEESVLDPGDTRWNRRGMHHVDPHQIDGARWLAAVDGKGVRLVFGLQY